MTAQYLDRRLQQPVEGFPTARLLRLQCLRYFSHLLMLIDLISYVRGSYGDYATLAGVTFTPQLYAAAIDYEGVSNLITLSSTAFRRIGNPISRCCMK